MSHDHGKHLFFPFFVAIFFLARLLWWKVSLGASGEHHRSFLDCRPTQALQCYRPIWCIVTLELLEYFRFLPFKFICSRGTSRESGFVSRGWINFLGFLQLCQVNFVVVGVPPTTVWVAEFLIRYTT